MRGHESSCKEGTCENLWQAQLHPIRWFVLVCCTGKEKKKNNNILPGIFHPDPIHLQQHQNSSSLQSHFWTVNLLIFGHQILLSQTKKKIQVFHWFGTNE
jgi:hypothetical protein